MGIADKLQKMKEDKANENKQAGEDFLAKNKEKDSVVALPSGLQYEIVRPAEDPNGAKPTASSEVTVHYKGSLLNGKVFDSSYARNRPATFRLNQVIPGWTEGVQLMCPGAVYRFYIPYDLAYGSQQVGSDIPPYSTLMFDVELVALG